MDLPQIKNISASKVLKKTSFEEFDAIVASEKHALKIQCEKFDDAVEFLTKLKLSDLPNLNFVTFEISDIEDGDEEKFLTSLKALFKMEKRPLLISIINELLIGIENNFRYFHYIIEKGEVKCIEQGLEKNKIIEEIITTKHLTINYVLYALKELNLTLLEVQLNQLSDYFEQVYEKILVYAINASSELSVRFFNLFDLNQPIGDESTDPLDFTIEKNSKNLLSSAVEHRDFAIINIIFDNLLNEFYAVSVYYFWKHAMDLAFEREFFDIYKLLKEKYDLIFFTEAELDEIDNVNDLNPEFDRTLEKVEELHGFIKNGIQSQVKVFKNCYPHLKLCYIDGESALEKSIEAKQFELYSILRAEEFCSIYAEVNNFNFYRNS